jgi:copper resistance protein B
MRGVLLLVLLMATGTVGAQEDRFPLPPKEWPAPVMDHEPFAFFLLDRLEYRAQKGADALYWDAQAWYGGDYNKLWLKSEGQRTVGGRTQEADLQVLYARRIAPFWHLQGGLRSEVRPGPTQNYGVLAIQGIAPHWFNVEASTFFRNGEISGRLEAEYDQLLTQRLILQPRIDSDFSTRADPARGVGRGINDVVLGLRLRYEIKREFAPYVGITWSQKLGDTADIARNRGENVRATAVVFGLRVWY